MKLEPQPLKQIEDSFIGLWNINYEKERKVATFQGVLDFSSWGFGKVDPVFGIRDSGNPKVKLVTRITMEPSFVRPLTEEEKAQCRISGPERREDIDTTLKMLYEGIDVNNEITATFRDGNYIFGVGAAWGRALPFGEFYDIKDLKTLAELIDARTNPARQVIDEYHLTLMFEKTTGLPDEFRKAVGEFYKECISKQRARD